MGEIKLPQPVKLFIATLYEEERVLHIVLEPLQEHFGKIEWQSHPIPFTYTDYYRDIGTNLVRVFLVFKSLIDPGQLAEIKWITNEIEKSTGDNAKERKINLDPGYFDGGKIVLATTKNFAHRVYIGKGIFAEATIKWERGDFRPFPYTYPDYASPEYRPILFQIRELYRASLKELTPRSSS
ncbi:MAG: DUF4416 family protein [Candidatus Atribacteria bacterium]|nr:DUF4416 family protein [Candidatus Atribacteria bacterium]